MRYLYICLSALITILLIGCSTPTENHTLSIVAQPVFSLQEGTYNTSKTVTITCPTMDAQIRYTTNGTIPSDSSALYTIPLEIANTTTFKAKAYKQGWTSSAVTMITYTIFHPPAKPILIPHLGDTGDSTDSLYFNGAWVVIQDETNGIDAIPEVDGIKISWEPLHDSDLDHIQVYRFNEISAPKMIASISPSQVSFNDMKNVTMSPDSIYFEYSYFIKVFDQMGNSTTSDTVSYRLLDKQMLHSPQNNATLESMNGLSFEFDTSGTSMKYRVLLFDESHELLWSSDILSVSENTYNIYYTGQLFTNQTFKWRVDAFDWDSGLNMNIGSESHEYTFTVQ